MTESRSSPMMNGLGASQQPSAARQVEDPLEALLREREEVEERIQRMRVRASALARDDLISTDLVSPAGFTSSGLRGYGYMALDGADYPRTMTSAVAPYGAAGTPASSRAVPAQLDGMFSDPNINMLQGYGQGGTNEPLPNTVYGPY